MSPLASILIKVTITTTLALAGTRLARHSRAADRHLILSAAFIILLALPVVAAFVPAIRVPVPAGGQNATRPSFIDSVVDVIDEGSIALGDSPATARPSGRAAPAVADLTPLTVLL